MKVHVITCTHCGKAVTPAFSWPEENGPFVLRAFVECPECVEAQPDLPQAELELARRVADAAVAWYDCNGDIDGYPSAYYALLDAVREYRARVEAQEKENSGRKS